MRCWRCKPVCTTEWRIPNGWPIPDRQQFDEILSGCGYGEGVFEDGKMLGAWVLYYPPKGAHCLGDIIGLPEGSTAHMELALLDPRLRGQGMHSRMVKKMTAHAAADGYDYIASTVHPDNQASLRGVLGAGYRIFDTRPMYGGKMRCILYRSLKDEKRIPTIPVDKRRRFKTMASQIELVGKIGSMALIRREEKDIDYNIFSRLGAELRPGMIWVSSGAVEIGRLDYIKRTGHELTGNPDEVKTDYSAQGQAILMENYRRFIAGQYFRAPAAGGAHALQLPRHARVHPRYAAALPGAGRCADREL